MGLTAGKGKEGAGDTDLRIDGEEPNDERRLWVTAGGFIGKARAVGVPGVEGAGDATASDDASATNCARAAISGGAGLLEDILRAGRSILVNFPCCESVNWPSLVLRVYMWTDRSDDCVATNSLSGSHATPCT